MLTFETDYEKELNLSNLQKQFILCTKYLSPLVENEENYYRYKCLVGKALQWYPRDVQLKNLLNYTINIYKKLLMSGLIKSDEPVIDVLFEKLKKCYNEEELFIDLLSDIQWMDLTDEFKNYLGDINFELFKLD